MTCEGVPARRGGTRTLIQGPTDFDDTLAKRTSRLQRLIGASIRDVSIEPACWDMRVAFSNGFTLAVFCDHVSEDGFDGNWDFFSPNASIYAGPGTSLICETTLVPR